MRFPFYSATLVRVLLAQGRLEAAEEALAVLKEDRHPDLKALMEDRRRARLEKLLTTVKMRKKHGLSGDHQEGR